MNKHVMDELMSKMHQMVADAEKETIVPEVGSVVKSRDVRADKIVYKHVPVTSGVVKGKRIKWGKRGDKDVAVFKDESFEIPMGNAWYQASLDGLVTPVIMEVSDPEIRTMVLHNAMDQIRDGSKMKFGRIKVLITKKADSSKMVGFYGFRSEIRKIIGVDPSFKIPVSKATLPTFSQEMLELRSSTIDTFRFRVVDPKIHHSGINTVDGVWYIDNVKFFYEEYLSLKDIDGGKKAKQIPLRTAQPRTYGTVAISKSNCVMDTFANNAWVFCEDNGLELGDCHGAIDIEILKANVIGGKVRYHHGDVWELPVREFRICNIDSPDGVSRVGVQLGCCDEEFATKLLEEDRLLHGEPGIASKGKMFKDFCLGKVDAVAEGINATYSQAGSHLLEIKSLLFAIPKDGNKRVVKQDDPNAQWYTPEYESLHNQLNGRRMAYYFNHALKVRTSISNHKFVPHPSMLLDKLEKAWFDRTGAVVNYVIAPDDPKFIEQMDEFTYFNVGRAPQQYQGSIQEALPLRRDRNGDFILNPERIRNREGILVKEGMGLMVSYDLLVTCLNGDYDGDIATEVFSNVAAAPMWRPELRKDLFQTVISEPDAEVKYIESDEDYVEEQKRDYKNIIWSQVAIGMFDNFARKLYALRRITSGREVLINGTKRIGKPIPIEIGKMISERREDTIKAKKHDIDVEHIKNVIEDFTRWYAPNGKLPKADSLPSSFLLLHNSLGLIGHEIAEMGKGAALIKRLVNLVHRANHVEGIHELDCYKSMWRSLDGLKVEKNNHDSQYWRDAFYKLWMQKDQLFEGVTFTKTTVGKIEWFAGYLNGTGELFNDTKVIGEDEQGREIRSNLHHDIVARWEGELQKKVKFSGYRFWAGYLASEPDLEKQNELYSKLFDRIRDAIVGWIEAMSKDKPESGDVYMKLLTICLGVEGFGIGFERETQRSYSRPGYSFWLMPTHVLKWVAEKVHTDNPYIQKFGK
jgi:hypothetical protein